LAADRSSKRLIDIPSLSYDTARGLPIVSFSGGAEPRCHPLLAPHVPAGAALLQKISLLSRRTSGRGVVRRVPRDPGKMIQAAWRRPGAIAAPGRNALDTARAFVSSVRYPHHEYGFSP
jgi:hypothetical protein